jgi:RimJ/RimL family protein N-acetyltransferase
MPEILNTSSLQMTWSEMPFDKVACGFPVVQINEIKVLGPNASNDIYIFERHRDCLGAGLVSCRLSNRCIKESMLLEDHDFRFIEMNYAPELYLQSFKIDKNLSLLTVRRADQSDLPSLMTIARTSFHNERFKIDPRIDPRVSDRRYQNWVANSLQHPTQELYVIYDGKNEIAFFITELLGDGTCYWHLNAVKPEMQGHGYGWRAWLSMVNQAVICGALRIRTSIVARNYRVLNLYARMGFFFPQPSMTFHWVR